jgi:hypothetical protein
MTGTTVAPSPGKASHVFPRPPSGSQGTLGFDLEVRADRLVEWVNLQRRVSGTPIHALHAVARALSLLLETSPELNLRVEGGAIRRRKPIRLLVQSPPEAGGKTPSALRVALLPDARGMSALALTREVESLAARPGPGLPARLWRLLAGPPNLRESVVISALGVPGIKAAALPPREGCALSVTVGALEECVVMEQGVAQNRWTLPVSLVFDARGWDPGVAHWFCRELKELLESPRALETADQHMGQVTVADTSTEVELPDPTSSE